MLIDFLQGRAEAKAEIDRYEPALYSVISWMEVMCGANSKEEAAAAEALFDSMKRIDVSKEVARQAVLQRKTLRLKVPDAIILASAECEGCFLVTRNSKDFGMDHPAVRIPYVVG